MEPTTRLDFPGSKPVWWIDVAFSRDGRYLAATAQSVNWFVRDASQAPGHAMVWDLRSSSAPPVRVSTGTGVDALALSPDGRILYTGDPLTAYDIASGKRIWQRGDVTTTYFALNVNPEGTLLALASQGPRGCARDGLLVRTSDGATVRTLRGQRGPSCENGFSLDGTLVGSVSVQGELIVWETATGRLLERWHTFDPQGIAFGPDNDLVHAGGRDSMLRTWDLSAQDSYLQQTIQVDGIAGLTHADLSPDGQRVAYRWLDATGKGWVRFVDTVTGAASTAARLPTQTSPWPLSSWHPDGGQYVGWCARDVGPCQEHGVVTVLDSTTGQPLHRPRDIVDGDGDIHGVAYVDGGRRLLVGTSDGQSVIFDAETLRPLGGRSPTARMLPSR